MTLDLEQMKADMAAGTPGAEWITGDRGASIYVKATSGPYQYGERVGGAYYDYDRGTDLEFSDADLERICRVPQLEAAVLAAEELAEAVHAEFNTVGCSAALLGALTAYRKATGGE